VKKIETNQDLKDRILVEDVKEFIKKLKKGTFEIIGYEDKETMAKFNRFINKLAGEELAGGEDDKKS